MCVCVCVCVGGAKFHTFYSMVLSPFYHRTRNFCTELPFDISVLTERLTFEICMYKTAFMPHIPPLKRKLDQNEICAEVHQSLDPILLRVLKELEGQRGLLCT